MSDKILSIISIIVSFCALSISSIIAIKGWMKNRNIYDLEFYEFFPEKIRDVGNKIIREKLNSGNFMILHVEFRDAQYNVLLGKINNNFFSSIKLSIRNICRRFIGMG